jgi:hypothetical protein
VTSTQVTLITDEDMQVPDEAHMCTRVFLLFLLERSETELESLLIHMRHF